MEQKKLNNYKVKELEQTELKEIEGGWLRALFIVYEVVMGIRDGVNNPNCSQYQCSQE